MIGTSLKGRGGVASVVRGYSEYGILKNLKIDYFPTHCDGKKRKKIVYYLRNVVNILIKIRQYSIVHIHTASYWSYRRLFVVILIAKLFSKKIIIHIHGAKFEEYFNNSSFIGKKVIKIGFKTSDRVICLSPEWSRKISKFCSLNKIIIIPNCVSFISINQVKQNNKKKLTTTKKLLFLGELGERKGVFDLLKAIKLLRLDPNKTKLFLCGNGDLIKIQNTILHLGLENVVQLLGWVQGDKKIELLRSAYLYVLPSHYEGLPMSILEAMSYGIPIVSTNVGGIPYAVESDKEGYLIDPGNPKELANTINCLLEDEKTWEDMSLAAIKKIKLKFSMDTLHQNLKKIYEDLLNE